MAGREYLYRRKPRWGLRPEPPIIHLAVLRSSVGTHNVAHSVEPYGILLRIRPSLYGLSSLPLPQTHLCAIGPVKSRDVGLIMGNWTNRAVVISCCSPAAARGRGGKSDLDVYWTLLRDLVLDTIRDTCLSPPYLHSRYCGLRSSLSTICTHARLPMWDAGVLHERDRALVLVKALSTYQKQRPAATGLHWEVQGLPTLFRHSSHAWRGTDVVVAKLRFFVRGVGTGWRDGHRVLLSSGTAASAQLARPTGMTAGSRS